MGCPYLTGMGHLDGLIAIERGFKYLNEHIEYREVKRWHDGKGWGWHPLMNWLDVWQIITPKPFTNLLITDSK